MKLAISGKGGVGKTTLSVFLAKRLVEQGRKVVLIDADPDANVAMTLGLPPAVQIEPLIELRDLIMERTGATGRPGEYFSLNPRVDDIPERYALEADGVKVLRMGRLKRGGAGCLCPENAFIMALMSHLVFQDSQDVVLDMEAGVEHLGRGTAQGVDALLVVVEPGQRSIQTAFEVRRLATDIAIRRLGVVVNKFRTPEELQSIERQLEPLPVLGRIPFDEAIAASDLRGECPYNGSHKQRQYVDEILSNVSKLIQS